MAKSTKAGKSKTANPKQNPDQQTNKKDKDVTDTTNTENQKTEAAASQTQEQAPRPQLIMHAQYIKDLSFENPNASSVLTGQAAQPNVEVGVNVNARKLEDNRYEVLLKITADAKSEDQQLFLVDLTYGGIVTVQNANAEQINPLVMIEGPRLLFPFARASIAHATREGGFLPLNIQPIDFVAVFRANIEAQRQQATQDSAGETKQ